MHRNVIWLFAVLLFTAPMIAQVPASDGAESFLGKVTPNLYRNDFFRFRLTKPQEMYVLSEEQKAAAAVAGNELLRAEAKMSRTAWEKAANAEVVIFSLSDKDPRWGPAASLNIGALRQGTRVTPKMVCDVAKEFLIQNPQLTVQTDTRPIRLAGKNAAVLELRLSTPEQPVDIRYYATIVRGHSLTFVITYLKKEELERFERILQTLQFFQ